MTGEARDGTDVGGLAIELFLGGRTKNTATNYRSDLHDFGRFRGLDRATAVADLLSGGREHADEVLHDYRQDLRRKGRAPDTIKRRSFTLRSLMRCAQAGGLIDWPPPDSEPEVEDPNIEHGTPYIFARHEREIDRLDVQHWAFRESAGANFFAPVASPRRILDVGSGTGQWGIEVLEQFPQAEELVGFDLQQPKAGTPARYRAVTGDVRKGLPFKDGEFDYVHQRLMVVAVPLTYWPSLVADLIRVTRPGGWIELVESPYNLGGLGEATPATLRLMEASRAMLRAGGLDTGSEVYDSIDTWLRDHGLVEVGRREVSAPIGSDYGSTGALLVTDLRAGLESTQELMRSRGMAYEEMDDLNEQAPAEWESGVLSFFFAGAWGRKPG